jgi:hypothetical protein
MQELSAIARESPAADAASSANGSIASAHVGDATP